MATLAARRETGNGRNSCAAAHDGRQLCCARRLEPLSSASFAPEGGKTRTSCPGIRVPRSAGRR